MQLNEPRLASTTEYGQKRSSRIAASFRRHRRHRHLILDLRLVDRTSSHGRDETAPLGDAVEALSNVSNRSVVLVRRRVGKSETGRKIADVELKLFGAIVVEKTMEIDCRQVVPLVVEPRFAHVEEIETFRLSRMTGEWVDLNSIGSGGRRNGIVVVDVDETPFEFGAKIVDGFRLDVGFVIERINSMK